VFNAIDPEADWPATSTSQQAKKLFERMQDMTKKKAKVVAKSEARQKRADGPVAQARAIFPTMKDKTTKEIVAACVKAGINKSTAATQLGHWRKENGIKPVKAAKAEKPAKKAVAKPAKAAAKAAKPVKAGGSKAKAAKTPPKPAAKAPAAPAKVAKPAKPKAKAKKPTVDKPAVAVDPDDAAQAEAEAAMEQDADDTGSAADDTVEANGE
jgi:hypothetical protein